jgi:hypothetical protein
MLMAMYEWAAERLHRVDAARLAHDGEGRRPVRCPQPGRAARAIG